MAAQPRLLLAVALAIAPLSAALVAPATPFLGLRALSVHAGTVAPRARPGRAVVALRLSAASSGVRPLPPPRLRGEFVCSSPGLLSYRTITSAPPSAPRALSVARALPRPPHRPARLKRVPAIFALAWQTASDADLQDKQLKDKIANFYDQSSPLWEDIWGEHMHMGHYGAEGDEEKSDAQAQIDMVDRLLAWGEVAAPTWVLDVGCGVGGSSRHMARKYPGAKVTGVTLSPIQCAHARARSEAAGLSESTSFEVADALNLPFDDETFDLLWSMESGEHMPNKAKWLAECKRVLKPGGRMLMATWTHRETDALVCGHESNSDLTRKEQKLLSKISKYYHLPQWVSTGDYLKIARDLDMAQIRSDDWSKACGPFWPAVWRTALSWRGFKGLLKTLKSGLETIKGARAVLLMIRGFDKGLVRLGLVTFVKP